MLSSRVATVVMSSVEEDSISVAVRMRVCVRVLTCASGGAAIAGAIATLTTDHALACTSPAGVVGITDTIGVGACSAIVIPIATGGIATGIGGNLPAEGRPAGRPSHCAPRRSLRAVRLIQLLHFRARRVEAHVEDEGCFPDQAPIRPTPVPPRVLTYNRPFVHRNEDRRDHNTDQERRLGDCLGRG